MAGGRVYEAVAGGAQDDSGSQAESGRAMEKSRVIGDKCRNESRHGTHECARHVWKQAIGLVIAVMFAVGCYAEDFHPITHRRIAGVMGAAGADWLTRPERESHDRADEALDAIGIQRGTTVADIGAGVGYFTWRLANRVGKNGVVYGEDIQ